MVKVVSKILITTTLIFTFFANNLFSENVSEDYVKFVTGSVSDKTAVLLHLSITEETDSLVATLPEKALDFVAENVLLNQMQHCIAAGRFKTIFLCAVQQCNGVF